MDTLPFNCFSNPYSLDNRFFPIWINVWTAIKDGDPVNNLIERTREIKNLVENKYKVELENIKKSQEHQKKSQNKAHRLTEEILPIGTKVLR